MTTNHTQQALENLLFDSLEASHRMTLEDFGQWLLHRAHRPDQYGQEVASNALLAWDLFRQFKRENGL